MRTIHHDAVVIPAYDETVYEYGELSDDAKENAFNNWIESGENRRQFEIALDEILDAVKGFCGVIGLDWDIDAWNNVSLSLDCDTEFMRFSDTGFYASMDIADAWNRHVDNMLELYVALLDNVGTPLENAKQRDLKREVEAALEDVREVTQRNIDTEWNYWIYEPKEAFEEFGRFDGFGDEQEYTEDGEIY